LEVSYVAAASRRKLRILANCCYTESKYMVVITLAYKYSYFCICYSLFVYIKYTANMAARNDYDVTAPNVYETIIHHAVKRLREVGPRRRPCMTNFNHVGAHLYVFGL